jgi:succinate-semialdehyde dehydrogenase/glutarate-semialdehyde dehydrogenase
MIAKMRNIGEACTSANRFHVAGAVAGDFAERLAKRMGDLKIGRGTDPDVKVGPLIDDDQRSKVAGLVDDAEREGREGPGRRRAPRRRGLLLQPDRCWRTSRRRAPAARGDLRPGGADRGFDDEGEAIAAANATEYGLVAYVFTRDDQAGVPRDRASSRPG